MGYVFMNPFKKCSKTTCNWIRALKILVLISFGLNTAKAEQGSEEFPNNFLPLGHIIQSVFEGTA